MYLYFTYNNMSCLHSKIVSEFEKKLNSTVDLDQLWSLAKTMIQTKLIIEDKVDQLRKRENIAVREKVNYFFVVFSRIV